MKKSHQIFFFVVCICLVSSIDASACTVEEMVAMREGGAGKKPIAEKCDQECDDCGKCSFSKVLKYVMAKKAVYEINDLCEEQPAATGCCDVQGNVYCNINPVFNMQIGQPCGCPGLPGYGLACN